MRGACVKVESSGGAVLVRGGAFVRFVGCVFANSSARCGGGVAVLENAQAEFDNCRCVRVFMCVYIQREIVCVCVYIYIYMCVCVCVCVCTYQ